ncbi:M23 family metallopeptidase [Desulfonatronum thioautotrophicum]|uniref:M23 family metallopeptidase n=1 Tax=Desulfonatronum thioautotrophicum TaxID=617001 RepID=UPI0005EBB22F|nr:M23 family metallopeptidase [Desulfonatronum thioautotrophicum]
MIRKKYQILLLKDNVGTCSTFTLRVWVCLLVVGIFVSSLVLNAHFYSTSRHVNATEAKLQTAQNSLERQQQQFLVLTEKLEALESQVHRVADFNAKVRVMANLDPGYVHRETSLGGTERGGFSGQYPTAHRQELLVRKMHSFLEQLHTEAKLEEARQEELLAALRDNRGFFASTPSIWPTEGWVTSEFGYRRSPFTDRREMHRGLDIAGPIGTPIYSTAMGTVLSAGKDGAYGKAVTIDHGGGIVTLYAHMHRIIVAVEQEVSRGELIGYMGNTGRTTGPHLHYEVRLNGIPVDPMRYILN